MSDLIKLLHELNPDQNPHLVIHSDVLALGQLNDPVKDSISAFLEYSKLTGATLYFPTFTYSSCKTGFYSVKDSVPDTGLINREILKLPDTVRSHHPIDSYAAIGPLAKNVLQFVDTTLHREHSSCAYFQKVGARFICWGTPPSKITMLHYYEFERKPSYRYSKWFSGTRVLETGKSEPYRFEFWVKKRYLTESQDFDHLDDILLKNVNYIQSNTGPFCSVLEKDLAVFIRAELKKNEFYLLNDADRIQEKLKQSRVCFLGSENLDLLTRIFNEEIERFHLPEFKTASLPYDSYRQDLMQELPELVEAGVNVGVFCERAETLPTSIEEYAETIKRFVKKTGGMAFILSFCRFEIEGEPFLQDTEGHSTLNTKMRSLLKDTPNIQWVETQNLLGRIGSKQALDRKLLFLGRIPFSPEFSKELCFEVMGRVLEQKGLTIRGLILDLDDTLWGGLVGEQGKEGLALGTEFPGNAYVYFQRQIIKRKNNGLLIALCSKNTESVALPVIESHPHMLLKKDDFSAYRINWDSKSKNIKELATELNLGFKNLAFIDDSPRERAEVSQMLPEIFVPDFPDDPSDLAGLLLSHPKFFQSTVSETDKMRAQTLKTAQTLQHLKAGENNNPSSLNDFYYSLKMKVSLEPYQSSNRERILNLINKTNQFNTTTIRYSEQDLLNLLSSGGFVFAIHYQDHLIPAPEDIGVVVVKSLNDSLVIENFLMSCRYLNRTIETFVLSKLCDLCVKLEAKNLVGLYRPSDRNALISALYSSHGFTPVAQDTFHYNLTNGSIQAPDWFNHE